MKLVPIPKEKYDEYRLNLMFDCYKWDPQFYDSNQRKIWKHSKRILLWLENVFAICTFSKHFSMLEFSREDFIGKVKTNNIEKLIAENQFFASEYIKNMKWT